MAREKSKCANPLWRDWIQEWAEEARERGLKTYFTYKKAADNLGKCPLQFTHPAEAIQIKGIGEGLVKRLERRLEKHCQENGLPMPENPQSQKRKNDTQGTTQDDGEPSRKRRSTKTYVPRYRTGAYAILLSMLEHREENFNDSVNKDQIISLAEQHCDSSFDMTDGGAKTYTAWNSIKTLIDKDLVYKNGKPSKYTLTEAGVAMAQQLKNSSPGSQLQQPSGNSNISNTQSKRASTTSSSKRKQKSSIIADDDSSSDLDLGGDEDEIDLSLYVLDPSKYQASSSSASTMRNNDLNDKEIDEILDISEQSPNLQSFNKDNNHEDNDIELLDISSSPFEPQSTPTPTQSSQSLPVIQQQQQQQSTRDYSPSSTHNDTFEYTYINPHGEAVRHILQAALDVDESGGMMHKIRFAARQRHHEKAQLIQKIRQDATSDTMTGYIREGDASVVCPGLPKVPLLPLGREEEDDFWPNSAPMTPSQQTNSSQTEEGFIVYPPDSYEIMLLVDIREIKMKTNRDYFLEKLTEKGIRVAKRALDLGDMIWVAQKRGSKNQNDELFLDVIVERKRLDDLVGSIKDGRYHEQKNRLQRSGAQKIIYIIEEYNKEEAVQFGLQAIQTAMSSTQVVDGFFLKRTANISDTVDYLVNITKMVQKMYEGATLYKIPDHSVSRQTYLDQKRQLGKMHFVSYPIFGALNSKSDAVTLEDVYMRMLMTTRGVTPEKANALIKVYPTPHSLLEAYASVKDEKEGKALIREKTKDGILRRRWTLQLSERLWQVWGQQGSL